MSDTPRCETCRYWADTRMVDGYCRRLPPEPAERQDVHGNKQLWRRFAVTLPSDWCGEHQPRERDPMDVAQR